MDNNEKIKIIRQNVNTHFVKIDDWDEKCVYLSYIKGSKSSQILHDMYIIMLEFEKFFGNPYIEHNNIIRYI